MGRWELVVPTKPSFFERAVLDVPARTHRVIFADLREVAEENLQRSLFASTKDPSAPSATRSAVLLVTPTSMPVVEGTLALIGLEDAAIVSLRRYSPAALRAWAVEVESGFTDDTTRRQLETVTGGWPILLAEVEETARPIDVWRALSDLESSVARKPEWWLAVVGLLPGPLTEAWASVSEVLGPEGSEPVDDLGAFVGDEDGYTLVPRPRCLRGAGGGRGEGPPRRAHGEGMAPRARDRSRGRSLSRTRTAPSRVGGPHSTATRRAQTG